MYGREGKRGEKRKGERGVEVEVEVEGDMEGGVEERGERGLGGEVGRVRSA